MKQSRDKNDHKEKSMVFLKIQKTNQTTKNDDLSTILHYMKPKSKTSIDTTQNNHKDNFTVTSKMPKTNSAKKTTSCLQSWIHLQLTIQKIVRTTSKSLQRSEKQINLQIPRTCLQSWII